MMKPPPFGYVAPESIEECVHLLGTYGDDAKIIAGGQSLMPLLSLRMVRPSVIIDIDRLAELARWRKEDGVIQIGALVRQHALERERNLVCKLPLMAEAVRQVGHPATRSRGTIVGSMCHADPAAELPVCALLLNAEFVLRSTRGARTLKADEFFLDALSTAAAADELVERVKVPVARTGAGYAFIEIARRHGDFALVSVAALVDDEAKDAQVALGGVGRRPQIFRLGDLAAKRPLDGAARAAFGHYVADHIVPETDLHASADYRRSTAETLVERALALACERAGNRS